VKEEPLVSVVRGIPTAEELAALVTVVAARSATVDVRRPVTATSTWTRSARPSMGPTSWRAAGLPH
jgi:hypothetical protein